MSVAWHVTYYGNSGRKQRTVVADDDQVARIKANRVAHALIASPKVMSVYCNPCKGPNCTRCETFART